MRLTALIDEQHWLSGCRSICQFLWPFIVWISGTLTCKKIDIDLLDIVDIVGSWFSNTIFF